MLCSGGWLVRSVFALCLCLALVGCGDDTEQPEPTEYNDPGGYGPPDFDERHKAGKADQTASVPKIIRVTWEPTTDCTMRQITHVELRIEVEDHDTELADLRFEGAVTGCNSTSGQFGTMINMSSVVLRCHHVSTHTGLVTVVDPQGNGDSQAFRFGPCSEGFIESMPQE